MKGNKQVPFRVITRGGGERDRGERMGGGQREGDEREDGNLNCHFSL